MPSIRSISVYSATLSVLKLENCVLNVLGWAGRRIRRLKATNTLVGLKWIGV